MIPSFSPCSLLELQQSLQGFPMLSRQVPFCNERLNVEFCKFSCFPPKEHLGEHQFARGGSAKRCAGVDCRVEGQPSCASMHFTPFGCSCPFNT
eukprot:2550594-Amphidinium_carterae.1